MKKRFIEVPLKEQIKSLAHQYLVEIITIRRHLHAHPELSFQEFNTSEYVKSKLREFDIPYQDGYVKTGITALIEGKNKDKVIALRADMDALPIIEQNDVPYKSTNEGVMHACGHDVHTASLLGVAKILMSLKDQLNGTVKLIFQPGEERTPGGASLMIDEGALENPRPELIYGQHVFPSLEAGKVGFKSGMYMASADELYVTVKGKGGHAAIPDKFISPLLIASNILLELQEAFMNPDTRDIPDIPTVLTFGKIVGAGATNVVPNEVKLEGTFRTFDEKWRMEAHAKMKTIAGQIASEMGGECDFKIVKGYPFLVNDEAMTGEAMQLAKEFLGEENVVELPLRMTAEDFAYYSQIMPGCFYRLGVAHSGEKDAPELHTPLFDIDEKALETGMGLMAWLAVNAMHQ